MTDTPEQAVKSVENKADNVLKKVVTDVKTEAVKVKSDIETELAKGDAATLAEAKELLQHAHDIIDKLVVDGHQGLTGILTRIKEFFSKL